MHCFHNILCVSHGTSEEAEALKQAFSLACTNRAALNILVNLPRPAAGGGHAERERPTIPRRTN